MLLDESTTLPLQRHVKAILRHVQQTEVGRYSNEVLLEIFEGNLRPYVEGSLKASMSEESYNIAANNIVVINVLKKVIEKLSKVYSEPVIREYDNEIDQDLIEDYEQSMNLDLAMGKANEYFNLNKQCALEPYVKNGTGRLRILTAEQYTVWSDSSVDPTTPTVFIKFAGSVTALEDEAATVRIYYLYSADQILIVDERENVRTDLMAAEGLDGSNPLGVIPFIYIKDSYRKLIPMIDSDLYPMAVDTSVALTNLNYANLFLSHSLIYGIDLDTESLSKLKAAPNKFLNLKSDVGRTNVNGSVGVITPQINIPDTLQSIQEKISLWLSSKGLRPTPTSNTAQTATNYASGIAKIIDEADAITLYKEQIIFFHHIELALWRLIGVMHEYWVSLGIVEETRNFSRDFRPVIEFRIVEPAYSEDILIDILIKELESGLTSRREALRRLNPALTAGEIDNLMEQIREDRMSEGIDSSLDFMETARGLMQMRQGDSGAVNVSITDTVQDTSQSDA